MSLKTTTGNFFEDFSLGQELIHATPRTLTEGDASLYTALYGSRFAVNSSDIVAMNLGFEGAPIDDMLVFHIVFSKTVPEVSISATANLGYSNGVFGAAVYPGDTLLVRSQVIGLNESSNGQSGVVYIQTQSRNQRGDMVLDYVRWVLIPKRDPASNAPIDAVPELPTRVDPEHFTLSPELNFETYETDLCGSEYMFNDYEVGEKIDHINSMTTDATEYKMAAQLYQNPLQKNLIYEGHVISQARVLSFNGLANAFKIAAINGCSYYNPTSDGDTVSAWSEILEKAPITNREDVGALRIRTFVTKNKSSTKFPDKDSDGKYQANIILDFDYWALMPI